jgi:hypothetical protein
MKAKDLEPPLPKYGKAVLTYKKSKKLSKILDKFIYSLYKPIKKFRKIK